MKIISQTFENGLKIATDQMNEIETVSLVIHVKAGSSNELPHNQGISHFLEHMAFKGTESRSAIAIANEFDLLGGNFNAYTSREKTVYYVKTLKKDISTSVSLLADILQNSTFQEEEIIKEKDVVLQEIAQTNDTPDDIVFDLFHETAYSNQAFGRSILGTKEMVQDISQAKILDYIKSNYYCGNIIIAAAGNINHDSFTNLISDKFNTFPLAGNKHQEKIKYIGGDIRIQRDLEQIHLVLGFESVPYNHPEYYDEQILSLIAGGGMSSRMFQEIREKRGLAYSVSTFSNNYSQTGMFNVYAATSTDKANECLDIIAIELLKLIDTLSDEEINRAKSQICASLFMSLENSLSRAEKLASNLGSYNRYIYSDEIMEKINNCNKASLQNVASRLFNKNCIPTLAAIGNLDKLYEYEQVKVKFK